MPILWYSEEFETYKNHKTVIESDALNTFHVETLLNGKTAYLPKKENWLKPITYRRNCEEFLGLYNYENLTTSHSKEKNLVDNYENKYISKNPEILTLVKAFSDFINQGDLKIDGDEGIRKRIEKDSKKLWALNVKQVQGGKLDDRPLYWARNKMQVRLKRHPLFKNDIDFEKSIVNSGTVLDEIIISFEELSRNYTGIDFSDITGKKLLITGFDPFILDPTKGGNPLQSNPSGINALALHGKTIGDYYIQTFIAPVRYKDFDEFKDGKGIIEKFITPFISKVDMVITVSQGGVFRFDVDRFPAKNRGGYKDNMLWGIGTDDNKTPFKQLTINGKEFYETTLPYKKIVPDANNPSDTFWVYFNQTYNEYSGGDNNSNEQGTVLRAKLEDVQSLPSVEGSGGDYLSNEIFYRVSKLREELKPNLQTGHLHIPLTQTIQRTIDYYVRNGYRNADKLTIEINPLVSELINAIKKIIKKCDL